MHARGKAPFSAQTAAADSTTQPHPPTHPTPPQKNSDEENPLRPQIHSNPIKNPQKAPAVRFETLCQRFFATLLVEAGAGFSSANTPSVPSLGTLANWKVFSLLHGRAQSREGF